MAKASTTASVASSSVCAATLSRILTTTLGEADVLSGVRERGR